MSHKTVFIVPFIALICLVVYAVSSVNILFNRQSVQAAQPKSAKIAYSVDSLTVYCEEPSGDKIFMAINVYSGGAALYVIPGGCK